jgi:hypothetical protein
VYWKYDWGNWYTARIIDFPQLQMQSNSRTSRFTEQDGNIELCSKLEEGFERVLEEYVGEKTEEWIFYISNKYFCTFNNLLFFGCFLIFSIFHIYYFSFKRRIYALTRRIKKITLNGEFFITLCIAILNSTLTSSSKYFPDSPHLSSSSLHREANS